MPGPAQLADADDRCLPLPARSWKGYRVARPAVDQRAAERGRRRYQTARHVPLGRADELIGRFTELVAHHHGGADPGDTLCIALLDDLRAGERGFDGLDATVEHAQVLAGVVIGEVLAQVSLGACRRDFIDQGWTARAQLRQLLLEGLEANRGHWDLGATFVGLRDRSIVS